MFQKIQKIISKFQNIQNRDFTTGETISQKLNRIYQLSQEANSSEPLIPYLRDRNKQIREAAAQTLLARDWEPQSLRDKNILAVSNRDWTKLRNLPVRELILDWQKNISLAPGGFWAAYLLSTLYELGTPASGALLDCAQNQDLTANARSIALHSLGLLQTRNCNQQIKDIYQDEKNKNIKGSIIEAFRLQGQTAVPILADLLSNGPSDQELCSSLAWALGFQGKAAVETLISFLNSTNRIVRYYSGLALLSTAEISGLSSLLSFKGGKQDGPLKTFIHQFLIPFGGEKEVHKAVEDQKNPTPDIDPKRLLEHFSQKKETELFIVAMLFLGNADRKEAARPLFRTSINSFDDIIKIEALMSLSKLIADQEAVNLLFNGLEHGDNLIRYWSCLGLMRKGYSVIGLF